MRDFNPVIEQCLRRSGVATDATAVRLFHGRGHCYPGYEDITVDRYADCLVVACFGDDAAGTRWLAQTLAQRLDRVAGACVQLRMGRGSQCEVVAGSVPDELQVKEHGLTFAVRPLRNQNVGLFLDMEPTRRWLLDHARECKVLNLFAYTCAFSVAAIAAGAEQVVNNDMSKTALEWGMHNHQLNHHDLRRVSTVPHNLFKSWWKIRQFGPYDIVIIDPPTNQRGSFVAEKQYGQVLKRLPDFCAPGAQVIACLNSPFLNADFLTQQMARWCPDCRFCEYLPVSADFPDQFPDRGLKIVRFNYN